MKSVFVAMLLVSMPLLASDPTTFYCEYPKYASPKGLEEAKDFNLTFVIDSDLGESYMIGNNGTSKVMLISGDDKVTFVEVTDTKNVMITTITDSLETIHSRNSVMFGDILPSQYYGTCEIR